MVGEIILGQFRDLGVRVITADSGVDLTANDEDPTRTLIRQVLGAVAQFEKSVIVLKLRAARDRVRKSNGRCEGRKPFGTRPGESTLRRTLGALLRDRLGLVRYLKAGKKYWYGPDGEARLRQWMIDHTILAWQEDDTPREIEAAILSSGAIILPLNKIH